MVHSDEERGDLRGEDPDEVEVVEVGPKRKRSAGQAHDPDGETMSAKEPRSLLIEHLKEIKQAWGGIEEQMTSIEKATQGHKELKAVHSKTTVLDQRLQAVQAKADATARKTDDIEGEVAKLRAKVEELGVNSGVQGGSGSDPWADYLAKRDRDENTNEDRKTGEDRKVTLSEEDQRSLILGGWLPDTKRATIETEAHNILAMAPLASSVDATKVIVFGPRRSFGILRFKHREGEASADLKARMWTVFTQVRQNKHVLESTISGGDEGRPFWASFLKTPEARKRSSMCSMTRRVSMRLAALTKKEDGEIFNQDATHGLRC